MQVPSRSEKEPTLQGFYERRTLVSNGLEREYFVFTPTRAEAGGKLPLVVGLHGYVGTATGFEEETSGGMNRHAEQEGYIAVYPQGLHFLDRRTDPPSFVSSWNDLETNRAAKEGERPICRDSEHGYACPSECGDCGACGWTSCADDIAFIAAVIESVSDEYPVDGSRRYVVGLSNGGAMAHRFACLRPDLLAAGVSVSGAIPRDRSCQPHAPISYMQIYGDADSQTPADGSATWDGFYYERPEVALTQWADAMGCAALEVAPELSVAQENGLICTARRACQGPPGTEVVNCLVLGGGHAWPGGSADRGYCRGDLQNSSIPDYAACRGQAAGTGGWGTPAIWEFLSRHQSASP
ncbi:MAG: hypothetical protein CL917_16365 [Deltaproteobacteria bacterium]|nr:hypothetical protein [Deltaproteobacteria bacterium]